MNSKGGGSGGGEGRGIKVKEKPPAPHIHSFSIVVYTFFLKIHPLIPLNHKTPKSITSPGDPRFPEGRLEHPNTTTDMYYY